MNKSGNTLSEEAKNDMKSLLEVAEKNWTTKQDDVVSFSRKHTRLVSPVVFVRKFFQRIRIRWEDLPSREDLSKTQPNDNQLPCIARRNQYKHPVSSLNHGVRFGRRGSGMRKNPRNSTLPGNRGSGRASSGNGGARRWSQDCSRGSGRTLPRGRRLPPTR